MYPDLKSTLLAVFPLQLCSVALKEILEQLPKVQVLLPCSELASDQYTSNMSSKSWRHPLVQSFLTVLID